MNNTENINLVLMIGAAKCAVPTGWATLCLGGEIYFFFLLSIFVLNK